MNERFQNEEVAFFLIVWAEVQSRQSRPEQRTFFSVHLHEWCTHVVARKPFYLRLYRYLEFHFTDPYCQNFYDVQITVCNYLCPVLKTGTSTSSSIAVGIPAGWEIYIVNPQHDWIWLSVCMYAMGRRVDYPRSELRG